MSINRRFFAMAVAAALVILAPSCKDKKKAAKVEERPHHPEWTYNTVIYEVNTRQYSPEGTFKGVQAQLPRLKELGVDILWFMPIYQIGEQERKGTLGSYYSISDYTKVNPEFGTMEDFEAMLAEAKKLGFRVILDWVANQTAPDHVWMTTKPADFYERDSLGNAIYEFDWTDTRSLNYENEEVWKAQDECMRFWMEKGIDGFRCDVAGEVPAKFWYSILPKMKADYPEMYLLAEAENRALSNPDSTFDATYAWKLHHILNDVAQGKSKAPAIKKYIEDEKSETLPSTFRLMFTSNHDENSWNGSEFERMGDAAEVMEVLCFTLPKGQPLVYTGQEVGITRRLAFFEKDPITDWSANKYTEFIKRLIAFRHANPALMAGEKGAPIAYPAFEGSADDVLVFTRDNVLVIANLSAEKQDVKMALDGSWTPVFWRAEDYATVEGGSPITGSLDQSLGPWDFKILVKK